MPQQVTVPEITQSLEFMALVINTLPSRDVKNELTSSLESLRDSIVAEVVDESDLQRSYEQFLKILTEQSLKSSGLDKSIFLMMVDIVMMIGYQLSAIYKDCQKWYNNLVAEYTNSSVVSLDIKERALSDAVQQRQELLNAAKDTPGVSDMLKTSLESMLHKTQAQLDQTTKEIEVAQKTIGTYKASAEVKSKEAELYRAHRDEHMGDFIGAGKVKIQKVYDSLSELRENIAAKLGITLTSDVAKSTEKSTDNHTLGQGKRTSAAVEAHNKVGGHVSKLQKEQQVLGGGRAY